MKAFKHILLLCTILVATLAASAQEKKFFTHTVSKGQTLYSISKMYNTTVEEIVKYNPESAAKLSIGQKLTIPQNPTNDTQVVVVSEEREGGIYHTIQSGETLYRLSKMYGVTPREICDANPGLSTSNFRVGEVILIPRPVKSIEIKSSDADETAPPAGSKKEEEVEIVATHKVKRGEDIEDICKKYGITEDELLAANPQIKGKKIKRKMVLNIPAPKKKEKPAEEKKAERELSNHEIFIKVEEYKDSLNRSNQGAEDDGTLKVALVLPFLLDSYAPSEQGRMVEYYQGFLMAVKELKDAGYSFEINTFDSGSKENSLSPLIESGKLDNMDLIIGAMYPNHNKELAKFAQKNSIPLVIPFTSKEDEIFRNPMVYIVNAMQSYIIPEVTARFTATFPNANVIFVEDTIKSNKKEFISGLIDELDSNGATHTTITLSNLTIPEKMLPTLKELLKEDKENIIIPTNSSAKTLGALLPALVQADIIDSLDIPDYKLFGYPEWQIHAKDTREQMYEVETYFYATFYSHYSLPEVAKFQNDYIRWYNRNIQNIYPRYGMLGYDTGYFFLLAASKYGKEMPERINSTEFSPVQTGFKFDRVSNWGGLVNKKIYFIHYTPEYKIEKIDFDR